MRKNNIDDFVSRLHDFETKGIIVDNEGLKEEYLRLTQDNTSVIFKVVTVVGGLFGSLLIMLFAFVSGLHDSETGMLFLGGLFLIVCMVINKVGDGLRLDTVCVTSYLLSFLFFEFSFFEMHLETNAIFLINLGFGVLCLISIRNYLVNFLSVVLFNASLLGLMYEIKLFNIIFLLVSIQVVFLSVWVLNEAKVIKKLKNFIMLYDPIRLGMMFSLFVSLWFTGKNDFFHLQEKYMLIPSLLALAGILYVVNLLFLRFGSNLLKERSIVFGMVTILLIPCWFAPALPCCLLLLLLTFYVNYRNGIVLSIIALIAYVSVFYYDLELLLLYKSFVLMGFGVLFLLLYWVVQQKILKDEKV